MRKQLLTKMLLIAASLFVGTSAWADPTSLYERGTTNAWAASDVASGQWSSGTVTAGLSAAGGKLSQSGKNGSYSSTKAISTTSGYKVAMTAVATMGGASGRAGSYDYITIGGAELRVLGQDQKAQVFIDGVGQGVQVAASRNAAYTFSVLINQTTGDVTYSVSGGATIAETKTSTSTAISNVVVGHYRAGKENYETTINLSNISITEEEYSVPTANYTVHFVDNNSVTVKVDDVRNGEVGATVGASTADKATFIADGNKYVYSSDGGGTTVTNDGLAEFTVTYTKYVSTSYDVKAQVSGSDLTTLASGTAYFDGSTKEYWSKYINVSDNWYVANETTYGTAITTATTNVAFTATDAVDYFFECEDFSNVGHSVFAIRTDISDASKGKAVTPYLGVENGIKSISTISSGIYDITIKPNYWRAGATSYTLQYSTDGDSWITIETVSFATSSNDEYVADDVIIPANSYLRLMSTSDATPNHSLDFIVAKKTADLPTNVSTTVTAAGWATLFTPYALDFSATGLTAYTATCDGTTVTLTPVENVPANTGVVLKGAANDYNIPVIASSSTAKGDLKGSATDAKAYDTTYDYYYLVKSGDNAQFKKLAEGGSIAAGKAYLQLTPSSARELSVVFEDGTTAISTVQLSQDKQQNECFDLQGRRVAQPTKGLYIVNGKKVVIK